MSASEFARLIGKSKSTVSVYLRDGMPHRRDGHRVTIPVCAAVRWCIARQLCEISARERLASEQADKVAMQNEVRRARLIDAGLVDECVAALIAHFDRRTAEAADTLAPRLAPLVDPGEIRGAILAETRAVRASIAAFDLRMADSLDRLAAELDAATGTSQ